MNTSAATATAADLEIPRDVRQQLEACNGHREAREITLCLWRLRRTLDPIVPDPQTLNMIQSLTARRAKLLPPTHE